VFFIIDPPGKTVFPVGLLLYWMTTNLWTVGQGLITRRLIPKRDVAPPKRSSRASTRGDGAKEERATAEPATAEAKPVQAAKPAPRRVKKKKKARR
jgi:YidC/Oxa1 family membrane protein insertase